MIFSKTKFTNNNYNHSIIRSKKDLKDWLLYERKKYKNVTPFYNLFCITEDDFIWKYQKHLRKTEYFLNTNKNVRYLISRSFLYRLQAKFGMKIKPNSCGKGLHIMHLGSILTNGDIGEDCAIHINVSVVSGGRDKGVPVIGNNVVIGVGAVVLGGVQLADGIAIGANALVNKSFDESDIAIAGCPAKKISNNGRESWANKNRDVE